MLGCTYEWLEGDVSDRTIANPYVTTSGTYVLLITSLNGCAELDTFYVNFYTLLDTLLTHTPTCPGGNNGYVIARLQHEMTDSARYYWDGVEGDSVLTGLSADGRVHTLMVESHGCRVQRTFTVEDPPVMTIDKQADNLICGTQCDATIRLSYSIPGHHIGDTLIDSLCDGTYITLLRDTAGCPYFDTTVIVRDTDLIHINLWADETLIFLTESTHLHATHIDGARYSWNHPNTLDRPTSPDPLATPTDTLTVYGVTVTDSLGCTWYGELPIRCISITCGRPNVFIPNAFSPNGDGINDRLCFRGDYITDFYIAIYTRWGEKVYETHSINDCWDGRYHDNWCMPGVYTYTCSIQCEAGMHNLLKGDITIIR